MAVDWQAELLDPIYEDLGVAAVLTVACGHPPARLTALDLTPGVAIGDGVAVQTIRPAAAIRLAELAEWGIAAADLDDGGTLDLNGALWKIIARLPKPSPAGEAGGELLLLLEFVK